MRLDAELLCWFRHLNIYSAVTAHPHSRKTIHSSRYFSHLPGPELVRLFHSISGYSLKHFAFPIAPTGSKYQTSSGWTCAARTSISRAVYSLFPRPRIVCTG